MALVLTELRWRVGIREQLYHHVIVLLLGGGEVYTSRGGHNRGIVLSLEIQAGFLKELVTGEPQERARIE